MSVVYDSNLLKKLTNTTTAVGFLFRVTNGAQAVMASLIASHYLHMSDSVIGQIISVGSIASLIVMSLMTFDFKIHEHSKFLWVSLSLGLLLIFLSGAVISFAHDGLTFILGILLLNIGNALIIPTIITIVGMIGYKSVDKQFGTYTSALSLALFLSPAIQAGILALTSQNLRLAILISAFPALLALIATIMKVSAIEFIRAIRQNESKTIRDNKTFNFFRSSPCLKAVMTLLMFEIPFEVITVYGGLLGRKMEHLSYSEIALAFSLLFFISLICRLTFATTTHLNKVQILIATASVTTFISMIGFSFNNVYFYYLSMAIFGVGHGITYPLGLSIIRKNVPIEFVRRANSTLSTINQLSAVVVPAALGFEIVKIGYLDSFLSVSISVCLFGILAFLFSVHFKGDQQSKLSSK